MSVQKTSATKCDDARDARAIGSGMCPVVAIGASAGGLDAFQQFLSRMSPTSGLAFVLVQHLDPKHDTLMAELLAKHTSMPVTKAADGERIDANHVYIVPPNASIEADGCMLRIGPLQKMRGESKLIDQFLRSLAMSQGDGVVAVILSGAGTDGTLGMKAVKEQGGLTIAQKPETAKYDSMPHSAIAAGVIDHVLTVDEMPDLILNYVEHLTQLRRSGVEDEARNFSETLARIFPILRDRTGHDFSRYKQSTLVRRIHRRMQVTYTKSLRDYVELLERSDEEKDNLFKDLLIGVTQFFRDEEAFQKLEHEVIPAIFQEKAKDGQVRAWVPGCATGEEAYSIAILLAEFEAKHGLAQHVQVFATDLDVDSLAVARKARYPEGIAEQVSPERLKRFFIRLGDGYEVREEIREMCVFSPHNLIKDPPFSRLDLISCRNVLIYLEAEVQRKLLPLFNYALNPSGFLFLGPSENVASRSDMFRAIDVRNRIFQRKPTVLRSASSLPVIDNGRVTRPLPAGPAQIPMAKEQSIARTIERVVMEEYAPPSVIINEQGDVVYFSGRTTKYLEPAVGVPTNKLFELAKKSIRVELRTLVHRALKDRKEVIREGVTVQVNDQVQQLNLIVRPLPEVGKDSGLFIVVFQEVLPATGAPLSSSLAQSENSDALVQQLEHELRTTKEDLQTTIEELETSNEELKSANEELLSMNEELQSTNEELQTSKEEVQSINDELQRKVDELDAANADLQNLFQSTSVATVFVDKELRITRFTPSMYAVARLGEREIGRRLMDVAPELAGTHALEDMEEVLRTLTPREREMSVGGGQHWFIRRVLPYRSLDQKVEGLVLTFNEITELKHAEAQRAQLAAIVEGSQDAIIGHAPDGVITSWNHAAEEMYGYSAAEAIGKPLAIVVPSERAHEMPAIYSRLIRSERVARYETQRVCKDGQLLEVSVTVSPIRDDHGRLVGFSSIARDITQLRRAAEQRARLAAIVESSDDAIVSKNLESIVQSWNRGAERIFGYTAEEMVGQSITKIIPPDRQHEETAILVRLRRGERVDHFETIRQRKDGQFIDVSVTISPLRDDSGKIIGASKVARDITFQKKAAREIERSHKLLEDFVENATEGLHWVGADGKILWANRAELELLGYTREEYIGHNITEFHADQSIIQDILCRLTNQEKLHSYEARLRCKDGSIRHVLINSSAYVEDGKFVHTRCFTHDITGQKEMEHALRAAKETLEHQVAERTSHLDETVRSLEAVCYTMAHDLRAPLRSLHGFAQILESDYGDKLDAEGKMYAQRMVSATERMEQLIHDLLEFAKLGHVDLPSEPLDLREELEHVVQGLSAEIETRDATITLPSPLRNRVLANATLLHQVLMNLVVNGLKFVAPDVKPHIDITAGERDDFIRICITDNGIGIPAEQQQRIFGLFQRLHTTEKYPGTGVGLAIVKRGIDRLGGHITVDSRPGQGSTFCIELKAVAQS